VLLTLKEAPMSHDDLLTNISPELLARIRRRVATWPKPSSVQLEAFGPFRPQHRRTSTSDVTHAGGNHAV
jgi:hypothetical protein